MKKCGESGKPKGNGIKEGYVCRLKMPMPLKIKKESWHCVYAVVFWLALWVGDTLY